MNMVCGAGRYCFAKANIERVNLVRLQLLQGPFAQCRDNVTAEQLGIALSGAGADFLAALAAGAAN